MDSKSAMQKNLDNLSSDVDAFYCIAHSFLSTLFLIVNNMPPRPPMTYSDGILSLANNRPSNHKEMLPPLWILLILYLVLQPKLISNCSNERSHFVTTIALSRERGPMFSVRDKLNKHWLSGDNCCPITFACIKVKACHRGQKWHWQ